MKKILTWMMVGAMLCCTVFAFASGAMESNESIEIRTPKAGSSPVINSVEQFGVRPNHPLLYKIPATGKKPLLYSAQGLPAGVSVDAKSGVISGKIAEVGEYPILLNVKNDFGVASKLLTLVVGEKIGLTPVMGWNSWYVWSEGVSQEKILAMAKGMADSGMIDYGWSYINIDDCWQSKRGGKFNAIQPNDRFPNMKKMCAEIHEMGLKTGIYSTPWMGSYAGFIGSSSYNAEGDVSSKALPTALRPQENQFFGRYPGSLKLGMAEVGDFWFGKEDAAQWADWGFDLIKFDWNPIDTPTTKRIHEDLRGCGRDIILSLSNNASLENGEGLAANSEYWRISGDIRDTWSSIQSIVKKGEGWKAISGSGHFADLDMLQVGQIGIPNSFVKKTKPSNLTPYEQYSQITYWALFSSPMLVSCDLTQMDDFTLNLLCNNEVNAINQDILGKQAIKKQGGLLEVWVKDLANGDKALGVVNKGLAGTFKIDLKKVGIEGKQILRDCWRQQDMGEFEGELSLELKTHDSALIRVHAF